MYCPQCGTSQSDDLKFCKTCGVNLAAVRKASSKKGDQEAGFDWNKTWVAEMLLSESERKKRDAEVDRQRGLTEDIKRYNEIKDGVITGSVGLAVMIFLYVLTQGIIAAGVPSQAAHILSVVWVAGIIPLFVGLGMILNGVVVSKRMAEAARRELQSRNTGAIESAGNRVRTLSAPSDEWPEPVSSITENTTRELRNARQTE